VCNIPLETTPSNKDPLQQRRHLHNVVQATTYDFKEQLKDLLSDRELFGDLNNLVINPEDRWSPHKPPTDGANLDEVFDGKWHQDTVHVDVQVTVDGKLTFWLPTIICINKTGTDACQRHGLEPAIFAALLLHQSVHNSPATWCILGFIPDLEAKLSAAKKKASETAEGKGVSVCNCHKCLEVVLKSFKDAQQEESFNVQLHLGDEVHLVSAKVPLAFVISDAKSGDMLCSRFATCNTSRMSRTCLASFAECSDPNHQCKLTVAEELDTLSRLASVTFQEDRTQPKKSVLGQKCWVNCEGLAERELTNQRKLWREKLK